MEASAKANDVLEVLPGSKAEKEEAVWLYSSAASLGGVLADLGGTFVDVFCPPADLARKSKPLDLVCHAGDPKALLVGWLEILQYILDSRQVSLMDFRVQVSDLLALSATCSCLPILGARTDSSRSIDLASAQVSRPAAGLWEAEIRVVVKGENGLRH
jgi:hypothetical protein